MANANAIVEKLAGVGLRHGEKAGVAIAVTVFLLCVAAAASQQTIDTSPEKVKAAADASNTNLSRTEDRESIVKRLEEKDNIKPTNFAATVEEQIKVKIDSTAYKPRREWVSPEPGAGLIRDQPKLIAPTDLYAYPGRGGLLVFALDEDGEKIPLKEGEEDDKKQQKYGKVKKKRGGGMGGGMMGGMGGGMRKKKKTKSKQELDREAKEERARKADQIKNVLVGSVEDAKAEKDESADKEEGGPFKQTTKGYRWVAITGLLDHEKMLANYREALKNPAIAQPQYLRLDLERRTLQDDGTWSGWKKVEEEKNLDILDNLPAIEEELAPENVRPEGLVDPLPFLNAGLWEKVHIASLVPKEKIKLPEEPKRQAGGMGGTGRGGMGSGQMADAMQRMNSSMMNNMQRQSQNNSGGAMMEMMSRNSMGAGGGGLGSSESAGNFWKSQEKRVMIRALDFTAEPDHSYRYRVRIVVYNPNYKRDDIVGGIDNKSKTLAGPWSKETDIVTMPPDVQPYAVRVLAAGGPQVPAKLRFQVVRFNPADGWTVPHTFDAGVGDVIGDRAIRQSRVPTGRGRRPR